MDRRKFIKTSLCAGCVAALGGGCFFSNNKNNDLAVKPWDKFKYTDVSQLPTTVRLEACNDCQLNCAACWMRKTKPEDINKVGGFGYLKFDDFKNFVDKHNFIKDIELSNNGEIFLNPELDDIIKYAYEKGIKLTAYNGVNLNTVSEQTLENLVKYKFYGMSVSIDGATPDVYKIYRRGGDLNVVINNIETINKYKQQYNSDSPYLTMNFILFGHNEHEIDAAKDLAHRLNMDICFIKNVAPNYSPLKDIKMIEEKTGLKFPEYESDNIVSNEDNSDLKLIKPYDKISNKNSIFSGLNGLFCNIAEASEVSDNNNYYTDCYQLSRTPQINFNGDLLGCCVLYLDNFQVNVFKEGLLNALNSENVLKAKLMLSDFSVEPFTDIPCSKCTMYEGLKNDNHPVDFFTKV